MNSRAHWEALVRALDQKKISMIYTSEHMVNSLIESPDGAIMFTEDDLPLGEEIILKPYSLRLK